MGRGRSGAHHSQDLDQEAVMLSRSAEPSCRCFLTIPPAVLARADEVIE
jgi:hypothetical protein